MSRQKIEVIRKIFEALDDNQSTAAVAHKVGVSTSTVQRLKRARASGERWQEFLPNAEQVVIEKENTPDFLVSPLPSDDIAVEEIIARACKDFEKYHAAHEAKKWRKVNINIEGPIGIMWFGDPHIDNRGCNWPLLKRDLDILKNTEGMFGANVGDTHDNWIGRLARLYEHSNMSKERTLKVIEWLFTEHPWLLIVLGNHDLWSGTGNPLDYIARGQAGVVSDWKAQIELVFKNGRSARIWCEHDFKGYSMYNDLHGAQRKAHFNGTADLYISGHRHQWGIKSSECGERDRVYWLAMARGYKYVDNYAEQNGFDVQKEGACIVSIIDPEGKGTKFISCFPDAEEAASFLRWKRSEWKKGKK